VFWDNFKISGIIISDIGKMNKY